MTFCNSELIWIDMITQFNIFLLKKSRICPRNSNQSGWHRLNLWQTVSFVSFVRGNPRKFYTNLSLNIIWFFNERFNLCVKLSNPVLDLKSYMFLIYNLFLIWHKPYFEKMFRSLNIPHNCYGRHGRCPCKFFLPGVIFSRLNAKNHFTV